MIADGVEFVFRIPDDGWMGYFAIQQRDLPLIMGVTMVIAIGSAVVIVLQDVTVPLLDPRIES